MDEEIQYFYVYFETIPEMPGYIFIPQQRVFARPIRGIN